MTRQKKMTKALKIEHATLETLRDRAIDGVYSVFPENNIPFNKCFENASQQTKDAYTKAASDLWAFENKMVAEGRAYRSTFGNTVFYN